MMTVAIDSASSDAALWQLVCGDDRQAFAEVVQRHQSAVAAVAYNACGDLTLSEDIAQEAFGAAWRQRSALLDPSRLRAWLCGTARNLAKNVVRRTRRSESLDAQTEPATMACEPADEAVSREEQTLVWQALEEIPETYREPLILFHREHQSVAEVAMTLELSPDAVKQRLSRGRDLLREQVAELVERTLRGSRPRAGFTAAVMAGLTVLSAGTKTAVAGTGAVAAGAGTAALKSSPAAALASGATTAGATGLLGGLFGMFAGLAGGWFGTWLPAQLAPTNRERQHLSRVGRRMLIVSALASLLLLIAIWMSVSMNRPGMQIAAVTIGWFVLFQGYVWTECFIAARAVQRIRSETPTDSDRNSAPLAVAMHRVANQWEGRVYRSSATLLGRPLIDIRVSTPSSMSSGSSNPPPREKACGWIAIGDRADGVLLAIGGVARGFIAMGGVAVGVISLGGLSLGVLSFGGVAVGAVALGGLGLGGIAFGGGAIGWQACGGAALAWDVAVGGGAVAYHAAFGGGA
ncbi:MAG: sigma-70 family RNA polymerase sigma factor, partial [Planctomycetaceae bacterium]|nr:sigma-70 family RNA polymerase sigma factor [Planctomycetaceae bacterium]